MNIGQMTEEKIMPIVFIEPITGREQEILQLIAGGLSNREIAETLTIAPTTVKKHASNIYGKLGVKRRTQAVALGQHLGLL
jgi:LuxR family maltose regulon positive regulatory protein